jgi:predicted Zn-ribbon and HTH transcriptional regulator
MKKILDTVIFGEYTAEDILILAGVMIALLIIFRILMRVFKREESSQYFQSADCLSCGWHGKVSTLAGRCPKCNQPLGDQKAHRMK